MNPDNPDPSSYFPSDAIEEASFTSRNGESYWILRHIKRKTYLKLTQPDYSIWKWIKKGAIEDNLVSAYQNEYPEGSSHQVHDLISTLLDQGFIHRQEPKKGEQDIEKETDSWISHYWEILIPLPGMGRLFDLLDKSIGGVLRSPWFPWIFALFCLSGLMYFLITEPLPSYSILLGDESQLVTVLSIYLILITAAILHVFGHALACKVYGRSIGDAGLLLYYGMPCLYIDTSDIWMADRKSRVIVSLAGPAVNLFIGACCTLMVLAFPNSETSTLLWRVAFLSFAVTLINLNPLLEFDGYYALADLLEIPDLRSRAFSFLRTFSPGHLHLGREGWFFLIYGVSSAIFTLGVVVVGIYFWKEHMTDLLNELSKDKWEMDHVLATLAIVLVFVPFFAGMIVSGSHTLAEKIRDGRRKQKSNKVDVTNQKHEEISSQHKDRAMSEERILTRRISK